MAQNARNKRTGPQARAVALWTGTLLALGTVCPPLHAAEAAKADGAARFRKEIVPILEEHCYDCHADGAKKGGLTLDEFKSDDDLLKNREMWSEVLKNVRAGLMPPSKHPRLADAEKNQLATWIKSDVFHLDPANPDPGRVTLRRLNRAEYRNTILELMGYDFRSDVEFPPDDSGHGFDNNGDVLSISPLLLEKYIQAASEITTKAVPIVSKVMANQTFLGKDFQNAGGAPAAERMTFYKAATITRKFSIAKESDYRIVATMGVRAAFDYDPGRCKVVFKIDGEKKIDVELDWREFKAIEYPIDIKLAAGEHTLSFELSPSSPPEKQTKNAIELQIVSAQVRGPVAEEFWVPPDNYARFFPKGPPPDSVEKRREYAGELLRDFASRAFRRPVDDRSVDRLVSIAEATYLSPGQPFEQGIARAMTAVLASPRFLFRIEAPGPTPPGQTYPLVDEYALASRLSYFCWSTMPDAELFALARRGELRANLPAQVKRLLADPRSEAMVRNFTGQWLQARDIESVSIDTRVVLGLTNAPRNAQRPEFDASVRALLRRETEMLFSYIVHEDRSVLDMIDCDYTFLNEKLAKHYAIDGVKGEEMRRVQLPKDSPRGGVLTQATFLAVTSNPTRTSPVKRGMFILENILGTPTPPPPPDIPDLEEAKKAIKDHEPSVRELMAIHRDKPLCASCHARMDPLGMALENFNAMGMWREKEGDQPIDASGKLITGEPFTDFRDLKRIIKTGHAEDFYRCLTEKLLTYALGRGTEIEDVETIDQIVERVQKNDGRMSALMMAVVESAPFQRQRVPIAAATTRPAEHVESNRGTALPGGVSPAQTPGRSRVP